MISASVCKLSASKDISSAALVKLNISRIHEEAAYLFLLSLGVHS